MDYKLELILLPVSDVDRAKSFYQALGFRLDVDHQAGDAFRVVQFTPPGSACSVSFGVAGRRGDAGTWGCGGESRGARKRGFLTRGCTKARPSASPLLVTSI